MAGLKEYKRENRESGTKWILFWTVKLDGPEGHIPERTFPKAVLIHCLGSPVFPEFLASRWSNVCFQHHSWGQLQSAFPWSIHDSQGIGQLMVFHDERKRFWVKDEKRGTGGRKRNSRRKIPGKKEAMNLINLVAYQYSIWFQVLCFVLFFSLG